MKFVIASQELNYLVNKLLNVVTQKATIPILSNILIEARNGELTLTATDLTVGIRCFTEAKIIEEGATTLPAKRLAQLIRELPPVNVEVTTNDNDVTHIVAGSSKFKLHGMSKNEYPSLPEVSSAMQIKVKQKELKEVLYSTSFAVSREDNRYVLTGVFLNIEDNRATFVGTDGKRLAKTYLDIVPHSIQPGSYIIPLKAVEEVYKNLYDDDEEATLYLLNDKIAIQSTDTLLVTKLLTGDYPDVDRVIPQNPEVAISLHRDELISLLRQISLFTTDSSSSVRFTFADGELALSANTLDVGEGLVKMPVNYRGARLDIAFNPTYFLDVLKHSSSETVSIGLTDAFNPGLVVPERSDGTRKGDPKPLYVLMPMRLGEE